MTKFVKIAEIDAESVNSANRIAKTLINAGFLVAYHEDSCYQNRIDILEEKQMKSEFQG